MDFLLVITNLISLSGMVGVLRVKIHRKSAFWKGVGQFWPNFYVEGDVPHQSFLHRQIGQRIPYNFATDGFHAKKLCSRLSSREVQLYMENSHFVFLSPLHTIKREVDFLLELDEVFLLGVMAEKLGSNID